MLPCALVSILSDYFISSHSPSAKTSPLNICICTQMKNSESFLKPCFENVFFYRFTSVSLITDKSTVKKYAVIYSCCGLVTWLPSYGHNNH